MNNFKGVGTYGTIGLDFAVSVALGLWAGRWADNRFHTTPWLMMVGLLLGVAVGFNLLWKAMRTMQRETERDERQGKADLDRKKRGDDDRR
jgi:F0F1-type ATP synthase assembly protein I